MNLEWLTDKMSFLTKKKEEHMEQLNELISLVQSVKYMRKTLKKKKF
jgi:hypothetical protein